MSDQEPARWGWRLLAVILDFLILLPVVGLATAVVAVVAGLGETSATELSVLSALIALPVLLYLGLTLRRTGDRNGQTLGKQFCDIRVARRDGAPVSFGYALLREVTVKGVAWAALPVGLLDSLWPLWDRRSHALHDKVARSAVVNAATSRAWQPLDTEGPLVEVTGLVKHFPLSTGVILTRDVGAVRAVDGIDLRIGRGETLGIVGESGCGKSTTARLLMRLLEPTAGSIAFEGVDVSHIAGTELQSLRREVQMIFQDPYSSLNPRKTVGTIIGEPFAIHRLHPGEGERRRAVQEMMDVVGLNPEHYNRYPHEFSGGQRQRIGVARALALKPKLIIADEPVSALDVSIQAQILNLLRDLQREFGLTLIFIAHDLSVVRHMCDRIAVMYLGHIVELADAAQLYGHPRHPYTGALMSAVPVADPRLAAQKRRAVLTGDVPSPTNPPRACRFHTRCPKAVTGTCDVDTPELTAKEGGNLAACHFPLTDREVAERVPTARVG